MWEDLSLEPLELAVMEQHFEENSVSSPVNQGREINRKGVFIGEVKQMSLFITMDRINFDVEWLICNQTTLLK